MRCFAAVILLLIAFPLWAEVKITNPGLPPKETIEYTETIGSVSQHLTTTLTLVKKSGKSQYEYRTKAAGFDSTYWLDPVNLQSMSSEITTLAPDAVIKKTTSYVKLTLQGGPEDLRVTDLGSVPILLRGYPFKGTDTHPILYVGNTMFAGPGINFEYQTLGRETVTAGGKDWDCWKVSTGLGAPYSWVLNRTEWWFAVEGTHPLIKTSGPQGGPGSPTRTVLLESIH